MRLGLRGGKLYWLPDELSGTAAPLAGPFVNREAAFTHLLLEQEGKLTALQRAGWAVLHEAARAWWGMHPLRGRGRGEADVLAALLTLMNGVRRRMAPAMLCKLAAGSEWRAWHARYIEATSPAQVALTSEVA